jgi:hypothetical protein
MGRPASHDRQLRAEGAGWRHAVPAHRDPARGGRTLFEAERDQSLEEPRARLATRRLAISTSALSRFLQGRPDATEVSRAFGAGAYPDLVGDFAIVARLWVGVVAGRAGCLSSGELVAIGELQQVPGL